MSNIGMPKYIYREFNYDVVIHYICSYKEQHDGNSPTIREIAKFLGGKSTAHIDFILRALEDDGKLVRKSRPGSRYRTLICIPGGLWKQNQWSKKVAVAEEIEHEPPE